MLKFFHLIYLAMLQRSAVEGHRGRRYAGKSAACAELWGLIFLCRVKVHTVKGVSMAKLEGPS